MRRSHTVYEFYCDRCLTALAPPHGHRHWARTEITDLDVHVAARHWTRTDSVLLCPACTPRSAP